MNIGHSIKTLRLTKGISQQELAELITISQTSLSQIESGIKRPSPKTLKKISEKLSVPEALFYILGLDENDIPATRKSLFKHVFPAIEGLLLELVGSEHDEMIRGKKSR